MNNNYLKTSIVLFLVISLDSCASSASREALAQRPAKPEVYAAMRAFQRSRIQSLFPYGLHGSERPGEPQQPAHREPVAVNAAWFDTDGTYGTETLQRAIDSGAQVIVVPALTIPWVLDTTVSLRSGLELIFEEGCRIEAKPGAFRAKGEPLFEAIGVHALHISGYGASWTMRKADYQADPYEKSQWRHGLALLGTRNVSIRGLRISSSGGDGVYLGTLPPEEGKFRIPCQDTVLSDLILSDHHRQGISIISATRLLIERCSIQGTRGTLPGAGIDFEPNSRDPGFLDCVVKDCVISGNAGPGILVALGRLSEEAPPLQIRIESGRITGQLISFSLFGAKNFHQGTIAILDSRLKGFRSTRPRGGISLDISR